MKTNLNQRRGGAKVSNSTLKSLAGEAVSMVTQDLFPRKVTASAFLQCLALWHQHHFGSLHTAANQRWIRKSQAMRHQLLLQVSNVDRG